MDVATGFDGQEDRLIALFTATFTDTEGAEEGRLIGGLVHDLLTTTPASDIHVFRAEDDSTLIGAAIFTQITYPDEPNRVVLLSPMAVATDRQGKGVGQALLIQALATLRSEGAEVALTYGDPDYYKRVGFAPITEQQACAPLPLSHPQGWIGQSLTDQPMPILSGRPTCVPALNRADVW
ncbi:Acetyltransferase (GNAT) family protein [Rhodobacteraceae bacterium THAF1]|uniref:GNAT family N-acetyltransferase n=1 Tax=Palleronia sp. THAF1 TaxID=2587842 RepID=UPI000F3BA7ED|nr:N-acetyltransferase [Palleronia sp. THAF1]QFU09732.1 Acetyltransferase (GNAT) family protein [Palleronia sp. THAF1]VDC17365.1 Acetyltransferase (GNAT) family protein [Rhodobacteraceae bacterium THAF1]